MLVGIATTRMKLSLTPSWLVCLRSNFVVSGGAGGEIRAWELSSRGMVSNMKQHNAPITDIAILSDDAHLVASSEDRSWSLW